MVSIKTRIKKRYSKNMYNQDSRNQKNIGMDPTKN